MQVRNALHVIHCFFSFKLHFISLSNLVITFSFRYSLSKNRFHFRSLSMNSESDGRKNGTHRHQTDTQIVSVGKKRKNDSPLTHNLARTFTVTVEIEDGVVYNKIVVHRRYFSLSRVYFSAHSTDTRTEEAKKNNTRQRQQHHKCVSTWNLCFGIRSPVIITCVL